MPTVARFNVTPVKSTALHHPERIRLDERGAAGDRRFFFVDGSGKRFSGATKAPILPIRASYDEAADTLELRLPNGVVVAGKAEPDGEALEVNFYGRPVAAHVVDGDFSEALSAYVGHDVRLARPDRPGDAIDVRPVTLVSLESVAELARRGKHDRALDPGRFRMTIEIEGVSAPHDEDTWAGRRVRVGGAVDPGRRAGPAVRRNHARPRHGGPRLPHAQGHPRLPGRERAAAARVRRLRRGRRARRGVGRRPRRTALVTRASATPRRGRRSLPARASW